MSKVNDALHALFIEFADSEVNFKDFGPRDLSLVKELVKHKEYIVWINDGINQVPVYINDAGRDYYFGMESTDISKQGFEMYEKMMDPVHFDDFYKAVEFWEQYPRDIYNTTFHVRNKLGQWRWTHSSSKALNIAEDGNAHYILSLVHDIERLIFGDYNPAGDTFYMEKYRLYNKLSKREKEVMDMIVNEMTSSEIACRLFIEPSTIDSHRKNIKHKLGVKSSKGMVKFYLLFSDGR